MDINTIRTAITNVINDLKRKNKTYEIIQAQIVGMIKAFRVMGAEIPNDFLEEMFDEI